MIKQPGGDAESHLRSCYKLTANEHFNLI